MMTQIFMNKNVILKKKIPNKNLLNKIKLNTKNRKN